MNRIAHHPFREVTAVVLAGGESTRMGGTNKLLFPLDGHPLLAYILQSLSAFPFRRILVVTGYQRALLEAFLFDWPATAVHNPDWAEGMGTSVRTGVSADPGATGYLIVPGDMPLIHPALLEALATAWGKAGSRSIVRPVHADRPGHPVIFGGRFREELMALDGERGGAAVIGANREALVEMVWPDDRCCRDVDRVEDLAVLAGRLHRPTQGS